MFKFLRRLFKRDDPFVFDYHDGSRWRSADPIEVERAMIAVLGDDWRSRVESMGTPINPDAIGEIADKMKADKEKLRSQVLYAIDTAFNVKPYRDGEGMTELKRLSLLVGFNLYCRDLIELARPFVSQQSRASPSTDPPPVVSGSDFTSPAT